jgi:formylglycine-generating enzyme required for sulfatase activity
MSELLSNFVKTEDLQTFDFAVATISRSSKNLLQGKKQQWTIARLQRSANRFIEFLGDDTRLEMISIPGGSFLMGSPENEPKRFDCESPQHVVNVPSFFMGRYPITQAQWRAVARMTQVERELTIHPSSFEGDNHPVEQVSRYDVVEFCARLANYTKFPYRLPSEAEWEYACRAGTTTPFHFGETITTELANFNGADEDGSYNDGPKGEYREETTPVDHFGIANAFGLSDMHGNVWEWCQDLSHDSYKDAPTDGSAWLADTKKEVYILHGGSWYFSPEYCRSAYRYGAEPDEAYGSVGFRVCYSF